MCAKIPINDTNGATPEDNEQKEPVKNGEAGCAETEACTEQLQDQQAEGTAADTGAAAPVSDKAAEYLDMLQRLKAEFDNFRRRTQREKADTVKYATEEILKKLLSVIDNLQRGIDFAKKSDFDAEVLKGIELVERQLLDLLAEFGTAPFESLDQPFDPNRHEPMYTIERDDVDENIVVQEALKGYLMHDKVLRTAQVVVSRKPGA